jgi:replicative DNA helicase
MAAEPEAAAAEDAEAGKSEVRSETEQFAQYLCELMPGALDEIEAVAARSAVGNFRIPTGFDDLDALLGGWSQGYLIVVGGRPSSGKTTLLLNFCRAASVKYRLPTMLISGEMNNTDLQSRLFSAEARVPTHAMRTGQMDDELWARLARTLGALADCPLRIGTPSDFRIDQLAAEATSMARNSGLKLLLIDSLQWLTDGKAPARFSPEFALWRLKTLAETLKISIIITAYAERGQERIATANAISQLRHGSAIERVADVVIILDRPDQDDREDLRAGEADLIVAKNRNGPAATITVAYQGHYSRFVDMVPSDYEIFSAGESVEATAHDRGLYQRILEQIPPDGSLIDWLKNNFVLKALPVRNLDAIAQVAKAMGLDVIGFDAKEANDRYHDLQRAINNFYDKVLYYTFTDEGDKWLQVPPEWRDSEDRTQYNTAMTTIVDVRNAFVEAYDNFLQACHAKGIDRGSSSDR